MKNKTKKFIVIISILSAVSACMFFSGCDQTGWNGYSNEWIYPENVSTIYVEMFDSTSFRRGHEYVLTDAICKRIESETPYKIVSDRDLADTLLSGRIVTIASGILAGERHTGTPLEMETIVTVSVSWKNLKTGEVLINNETIHGSSTYASRLTGQDFDYSARVAVNRAAVRVVELMQTGW